MRARAKRFFWLIASFVVGAALVGAWQLIADAKLISPVYLPSPYAAGIVLHDGFASGELQPLLLATLERMFYGWLVASILGVFIGAAIGVSRHARELFGPTLEFIRPIPSSAVVPAAIALFGLNDGMVLGVIAFGAIWPLILATVHGFAAVEPRLYEVSRLLGLSRWQFITKVALPSATPDILAGMRISLTSSLILTIVGEILAGRDGIGFWVLLSSRSFRSADVFAGVILFGIIGYTTGQMLSFAESKLLRWRDATR